LIQSLILLYLSDTEHYYLSLDYIISYTKHLNSPDRIKQTICSTEAEIILLSSLSKKFNNYLCIDQNI